MPNLNEQMKNITREKTKNNFAFHAATTEEKRMEHTSIRKNTGDLAELYVDKLPEGREKAVALTKLEEAMFWANAAIARNNKGE